MVQKIEKQYLARKIGGYYLKKIVIITGANSGIGKAATIKFAEQGYRVVMACRNIETSNPVCREIIEKTNNADIELIQLDVSSKQSVFAFCEAFKEKHDVLDILINNAGHFKHGETSFQESTGSMELTFATNLFGPVLLTSLLLDVLAKSNDPKVLNACSTNTKHFFDERRKIDFKALCGESVAEKKYDSYKLYGDSKMALLMETFKMAQEYKSQNISVNAIMIPATKMSRSTVKKFKSYWRLLAVLQNPFIPKAKIIGDAYFSICTYKHFKGMTGKLINHLGQIVNVADKSISFIQILRGLELYPSYADDDETSNRIWAICNYYAETR